MSKFSKIALTVGAAGAALVAGVVLVPKLLKKVTTPSKPAPMASAPPPAPPPAAPAPQPSSAPGGTLGQIGQGLDIASKGLDVLNQLGLGNSDGDGILSGLSF